MSHCRLIFIRHGESEGNNKGKFLGHTDLDITKLGHAQAELTAEFLRDKKIDKIYSSDLKRAKSTAKPIAKIKNLPIIEDRELREIYAGKWENMKFTDITEKYTEAFYIWKHNLGKAYCTGGETVKELYKRIRNEVVKIAEANDGMNVCIVSHATPIRVIRAEAMGLDMDEIAPTGPANASVTVIDYEDGKLKMVANDVNEHLNIEIPGMNGKNGLTK